MITNDVIRRIRFALDLNDQTVLEIFELAGKKVGAGELMAYFRKEDEDGFIECPQSLFTAFLDGLILKNRGPREEKPGASASAAKLASLQKPEKLTNNQILKKLRIALELQEDDMLNVFEKGEFPVSKAELSALFRKEGHRNYKPCGDQGLKKFLNGLTAKYRGIKPEK